MAKIYDNTDLSWTKRGDLLLSHNGDVAHTELDPLRSIVQEIRKRVRYAIGELKTAPRVGASLKNFVGKPNNKVVAEAIKSRIISALSRDGLVDKNDLNIQYLPVDRETLLVRLSLKVAATPRNRGSEMLTLSVTYNYSENNPYFI
jgi:hypothetical protein